MMMISSTVNTNNNHDHDHEGSPHKENDSCSLASPAADDLNRLFLAALLQQSSLDTKVVVDTGKLGSRRKFSLEDLEKDPAGSSSSSSDDDIVVTATAVAAGRDSSSFSTLPNVNKRKAELYAIPEDLPVCQESLPTHLQNKDTAAASRHYGSFFATSAQRKMSAQLRRAEAAAAAAEQQQQEKEEPTTVSTFFAPSTVGSSCAVPLQQQQQSLLEQQQQTNDDALSLTPPQRNKRTRNRSVLLSNVDTETIFAGLL